MNRNWTKSTYSANTTSCVETRHTEETVGVRDSKDTALKHLSFGGDAWQTFIDQVRGQQ